MCARIGRSPVGLQRQIRFFAFIWFLLGSRRLDAISNEHVQNVKRQLVARAPKTVNNVLTVLSVMLKTAVEWGVLDRMPCMIRLLPLPKPSVGFYDFDE